jgi:hypothetical protein
MYDVPLHNLQFSWKYLQRRCLTSCMFKRRPPIFQTMNKENIIFLHSSEYGNYSHSLENLCQICSPYMHLRSGFKQEEITDDVQGHYFTCNCH